MVTDTLRRRLFEAAVRTLGAEEAEALMELLPPVGWADVVRQGDLRELRADLRSELAGLRTELRVTAAELRSEMAELRGELRGEMGELRGEMGELRGEVAELRGEVRAQLARLIAANVASMLGVAALVAAIVKIG